MLLAVNPDNQKLRTGHYQEVHNQGQLILALTNNLEEEVLLDPQLPGHLSHEAFYRTLKTRYPNAQISVVENPGLEISQPRVLPDLIIAGLIWIGVFAVLTYDMPGQKTMLLYSGTALLAGLAVVFAKGGIARQRKAIRNNSCSNNLVGRFANRKSMALLRDQKTNRGFSNSNMLRPASQGGGSQADNA